MAFLTAIDKYDPARGAPFWPYAKQWVRGAITNHVSTGRLFRRNGHGATENDRARYWLCVSLEDTDPVLEGSVEDALVEKEVLRAVDTVLGKFSSRDFNSLINPRGGESYEKLLERARELLRCAIEEV